MGSVFIMKKIIVFSIHFFNATVCKYDEISEKRGSKMPPQTINLNRYLVRNHLSLVPSTFFMTFFSLIIISILHCFTFVPLSVYVSFSMRDFNSLKHRSNLTPSILYCILILSFLILIRRYTKRTRKVTKPPSKLEVRREIVKHKLERDLSKGNFYFIRLILYF